MKIVNPLSLIKTCLLMCAFMVTLVTSTAPVKAAIVQDNQPTAVSKTVAAPATKERKANPNTQYGKAQQLLKGAGLYRGEVTGYKNDETVEALKAYQQQNNLKVTGTLSKETKDKMGIVAGTSKSVK
ncbi:MAG: peptidoglycan-binding protein [Acidobacteria bacterium]|nr:peptidoglycan-binding protein [Acidobacteriota bacterium]